MGGEAATTATAAAAAASGREKVGTRRRRRRRVLSFVGQTAHTRRNEPLSYGPVSACALFTHTRTHTHTHACTYIYIDINTPVRLSAVSPGIIIFKKINYYTVRFFLFPSPHVSA